MTRIEWDAAPVIENGVDQGVLYPRSGPGVPWTGLVGVEENVEGGDHTPYYFDGLKYYDFIASESFQAKVNAYSAPLEFAPCEGVKELSPGLYAGQQRRERFGFSYRTLVGGENGEPTGHKIHLVYNITAAPSSVSYATLTNTVAAPTREWIFHTVAPKTSDFKPTAHFMIDSREVSAGVLEDLEDVIYGASGSAPELPTLEELIAIMS